MKNEIRKVINASGKMSILGTSTVSDGVSEAMKEGAQNFYVMKEYLQQLEDEIAEILGFDASKIVASAASGIVTTVSAVIGRDTNYALNPRTSSIKRRNILIPKGHNVNFGAPLETMIEFGGGNVVELGYANECTVASVEDKIDEYTAGLLYIQSHHSVQKNMLSIEDMVAIGKKHQIPVIVDAAAEEDPSAFNQMDIDLLIFSGSKALEGPSSGLILGNKEMIAWCKDVDKGLGRAMKVTKEMATGLYKAIEERHDSKEAIDLTPYQKALNGVIDTRITKDPAGREIYRLELKTSPENAKAMIANFEQGNPAIFTRNYNQNQGLIEIDTRALDEDDLDIIVKRIKEFNT